MGPTHQCDVNDRSPDDYEQGHTQLSGASRDIHPQFSSAPDFSETDLMILDHMDGGDLHPHNQLTPSVIQSQYLYCEKYDTAGRWICKNGKLFTCFFYDGQLYYLPFSAHFTEKMLPCLREAASLQIESKIDDLISEKDGFEDW